MVLKLSGYAKSVKGHGRQQVIPPATPWQNLPSTTEIQTLAMAVKFEAQIYLHPPPLKTVSWKKGAGHTPRLTAALEFDIVQVVS